MVHVSLKDVYKPEYTCLWSILSFKAGLLNASGFLIAGSYVSHVTGFGTQMGLAIGHEEISFGLELLVIPLAFIGGAFLSSWILDHDYSDDKIPNYPLVQSIITLLHGIIALLFSVGVFAPTSPLIHDEKSIILIGLLCLVCGLKNGLTTWSTHGKIRVTHLTGLSTDIGLHLPKLFRSKNSVSRYPESKWVTYVRLITLLSFSLGSCIAALLIPVIGYKIFHLTFFMSAALMAASILHRRKLQPTLIQSESVGVSYANVN
jgi:uncharacterized membrane protein YoaK (UPF0700 family)